MGESTLYQEPDHFPHVPHEGVCTLCGAAPLWVVPVEPDYEAGKPALRQLISFIRTPSVVNPKTYEQIVDDTIKAIADTVYGIGGVDN